MSGLNHLWWGGCRGVVCSAHTLCSQDVLRRVGDSAPGSDKAPGAWTQSLCVWPYVTWNKVLSLSRLQLSSYNNGDGIAYLAGQLSGLNETIHVKSSRGPTSTCSINETVTCFCCCCYNTLLWPWLKELSESLKQTKVSPEITREMRAFGFGIFEIKDLTMFMEGSLARIQA